MTTIPTPADCADGFFEAEHGHLREQERFAGSLRLVVAEYP